MMTDRRLRLRGQSYYSQQLAVLQNPVPSCSMKKARWYLFAQWVALQERNPVLTETISFILDSKHSCSLLRREALSLSPKVVCYTNFIKTVWDKVPLLTRLTEMWETHRESSPNTFHLHKYILRKMLATCPIFTHSSFTLIVLGLDTSLLP